MNQYHGAYLPATTEDTMQRHAITMWDFSWLLRREGDQAEYADLARVCGELVERGYDTVRIDAFPHWIAADSDGSRAEEFIALPQPADFMWGNHGEVTVRPRQALLEFLGALRDRGARAALSTWFTPDSTGRADRVVTPGDLSRIWIETLEVVREAGLLEAVAYVDLCNEWPLWAPGIGRHIYGFDGRNGGPPRPFNTEELAAIDSYQQSIVDVRAAFPGLPLTFSLTMTGNVPPMSTNIMRLDTTEYDFAETHLWLSGGCPLFAERTEYSPDYDIDRLRNHEERVRERYPAEREAYLAELAALMRQWRDWAADRDLDLWTTEGWATVGWNPTLVPGWDGWDYIKDVGAAAVDLAIEYGWRGICTSNFSQPHHVGMWADAEWHREQNAKITG